MAAVAEDAVTTARSRIAERQKRSDQAFKSWRAGANPRLRELKRREQASLLTEAGQRAKEEARRRAEQEQQRDYAHRALQEQRRRDADKRWVQLQVHERRKAKEQALYDAERGSALTARRDERERQVRLREEVLLQTVKMWKAMVMSELKSLYEPLRG
ncbi:hypothetical protein T492DRAFT_865765 [Pavlovales sp. CCMP2436]|nr:hypothetical protein T492DRAFT_865765 [Pavlovales sp. CCMP2436]|mmetsp:Transcript_24026/g.60786  ORF Transcript_24026/g.60786 Transcript_24026/m.60786 type:complete len:158 (+) Transcript_24026:909-1382(+)